MRDRDYDPLDERAETFTYQLQPYVPRQEPDNPHPRTSQIVLASIIVASIGIALLVLALGIAAMTWAVS
jgi:hypothetical protein